jgi:serine/threonine-protein kinase
LVISVQRAARGAGNVYFTDFSTGVLELRPGATSPTVLPLSGLHSAGSVALDTVGNRYVTDDIIDNNNFDNSTSRVLKFAVGSASPTVLPFTGLHHVQSVAVDTAGNGVEPQLDATIGTAPGEWAVVRHA